LACAARVAYVLREAGATHKKDAFGEEPFQILPVIPWQNAKEAMGRQI